MSVRETGLIAAGLLKFKSGCWGEASGYILWSLKFTEINNYLYYLTSPPYLQSVSPTVPLSVLKE